jgi:pilus assembly protein Flp/PilA
MRTLHKFVALTRRMRDRVVSSTQTARNFLARREEGASLVEYALLVALIALACIAAVGLLGNNIANAFNNIGGTVGNNVKGN